MASSERFGYEWNKYKKITKKYELQFLKWVFPLKKEDFKEKSILDCGCGMGRNSFWPLKYGAKEVVAFDLDSRTLKAAKNTLRHFPNAKIMKGSIYDIPFENHFDIVFSIGVIHHLKDPRKAIEQMIKATKRKGEVLIWVYGYESNEWIVRYVNPIRKITSKLPVRVVDVLSLGCSFPLFLWVKLFPQKHAYLRQLSKFKFWHIHSIVLDQLIPTIANYWTHDQALHLLKDKGLSNVKAFHVNNNSWSVIGTKD